MKFFKPNFWNKNQISLFSILLLPLTLLFIFLSSCKKLIQKEYACKIPVICIGNIYVGGTGKTPLSIALFNILKNLKKSPAFIRKKYAAFQDETNLQKVTGPVFEDALRINAINNSIESKINVAILDDGFQDFSIKKDLSIVCFTEKQWIGNGLRIPSGPLRENLTALKRAHFVVINGKKNPNIENKIIEMNKLIKIFYSEHIAENINNFKDKKIVCFAGIGNPENFFNLLNENKIDIAEQLSFPDHYNYSEKEVKDLIKKAENYNAVLLTTEKDYLRIDKTYRDRISFLKIKTIIKNEDDFINEIKKII